MCKCVFVCPTLSDIVVVLAQKSDTIMMGPSVQLSVCVRECLPVSVLDSERETWMEDCH